MGITRRQLNNRRSFMPVKFPLLDSDGELIFRDRRQLTDRRKRVHSHFDLNTILSKIYSD